MTAKNLVNSARGAGEDREKLTLASSEPSSNYIDRKGVWSIKRSRLSSLDVGVNRFAINMLALHTNNKTTRKEALASGSR